ncbi:MAG: hypothetical protein JXB49_16665 [Bacteroidales bacterium]|nr:hypothetical protein [Bacteroidales bacterium]
MFYFVSQSTFTMEDKKQILQDISEIRNIMEQSTRFMSLSGLSGIFAGIFALIGSTIAFFHLDYYVLFRDGNLMILRQPQFYTIRFISILLADGASVLFLALASAVFFSTRKAKKKNLPIWNNSAKRMLVSVFLPLVVGGMFCFILLYHRIIYLIAPCTLIFYGLALLNGSKYTLREVQYLGLLEILTGLVASFFIGYSLLFWAFGFGILHIVYGALMYFRYER